MPDKKKACVWVVAGSLIGGMKKKSEKDRIRRGLNVLVATPGRLCDHLDTTMALDLSKLKYLVFDEADRMLDMDFEKKINFIIFKIHSSKKRAAEQPPEIKYKLDESGEPVEDDEANAAAIARSAEARRRIDPQTILLSATLTSGIKEIARRLNIADAEIIDAKERQGDNQQQHQQHSNNTSNNETVESATESDDKKVALPATLSHYYLLAPSKLRLIALISFILDKMHVCNNI